MSKTVKDKVLELAVDLGFGVVKIYTPDGRAIEFPSIEEKISSRTSGLMSIAGSAEDYFADVCLIDERGIADRSTSERYAFGKAALSSNTTRKNWTNKGDVFSQEQIERLRRFVGVAVSLIANNTEFEKIKLSIGLPMSEYGLNKQHIIHEMGKTRILVGVDNFKEVAVVLEEENIKCFPQGLGAFYAEAMTIEGKASEEILSDGVTVAGKLLRSTTGIIDIGFKTADYLIMTKAKTLPMPVNKSDGSSDKAMNTVYEKMQEILSDEKILGVMAPIEKIEEAVMDCLKAREKDLTAKMMFKYGTKTLDLEKLYKKALMNTAEELSVELLKQWEQHLPTGEYILLTGGGGAALYPYLKDKFPGQKVILTKHKSYANARGYIVLT